MNLSFIKDFFSNILQRKFLLLIGLIVFSIGAGYGVANGKETISIFGVESDCDEYILIVFKERSVFSLFLRRIIFNVPAMAICLLSGCFLLLFPLHLFIIFYKGFLSGAVCVIIISNYGICGILIAIMAVIPITLITGFAFVCLLVSSYDCGLENFKDRHFCVSADQLKGCLYCLGFLVCITILEIILVALIIRPIFSVI